MGIVIVNKKLLLSSTSMVNPITILIIMVISTISFFITIFVALSSRLHNLGAH